MGGMRISGACGVCLHNTDYRNMVITRTLQGLNLHSGGFAVYLIRKVRSARMILKVSSTVRIARRKTRMRVIVTRVSSGSTPTNGSWSG